MKQKLLSLFLLFTLLIGAAYAQERRISGTVTSSGDGIPLPGVSIIVTGTTQGTTTDGSGNYSLLVPAEATSLTFRYIGYVSQEIKIAGKSIFNVSLVEDAAQLNEVVVTAMGIQRNSKEVGYAITQVNPKDVLQISEPDMLKGLQGKAAGVDIRTSQGTPGAATRIQIRGNSSFYGNNEPLIVVDGIPFNNDQVTTSSQTSGGSAYGSGISNLDPNDIESMNILKGSAAAALYGSRASNGAVIITTKSGNAKRSSRGQEITFRSSVSMENIANLPKYQNSYGAGSQFNYSNSNGSWGPAFRDLDSIPAWPDYKAAYPELFPSDNIAYVAHPDNVKDLFNTGMVYENSLTFNGGNEKTAFSLTASQLNHNGYVPNSAFDRTNISVGGSTKLDNGLNIRANVAYTSSKQKGGFFGENQVDGTASQFARSLFLSRDWDLNLPYQDKEGNNLTPLGAGQFDNPLWSAYNNTATTNETRLVASTHLDYKINEWWQLDLNGGTNVSFLNRREVYEISSRAAQGLGSLTLDERRHSEIEATFLSTFTPKISDDFTLKGIVGFNYNQRTVNREGQTGNRFIERGTYNLINTEQSIFDNDYYSRRRLMGLFGDVTLGYKDYAFLTVTGRNDWSSTLPYESRSYFYPSISGSFVFTDAFNIKNDILDFGNIRLGYAKVGRDTDPYNLFRIFEITPNFLGIPGGRISPTSFDPNLKPEFSNEFEVGTRLSFLQSRIEVDFTYYNKNSTDLLAGIQMPPSTGFDELFTNFGKINNRGTEIELIVRPIVNTDFNWEVRGAFTQNKNIVKELKEGTTRIPLAGVLTGISPYLEAGMPYGYLRGTRSMRDDDGNLLINPNTGGLIEDPNEGYIGNPNPKYKLGITNRLSYKGFTLVALFDMTKGGDMYSVTNSSLLGRGVTMDSEDRETNMVIKGVYGDATTGQPILDANGNKIPNQTRLTVNDLYFSPNATLGQTFGINTASEWNIYDATVYRLREVSIGYTFPKSWISKTPMGSLTLSITGRNLWYIAPNFPKYSHFDPEVGSYGSTNVQGIELSAAPTTKRFGFNLTATF